MSKRLGPPSNTVGTAAAAAAAAVEGEGEGEGEEGGRVAVVAGGGGGVAALVGMFPGIVATDVIRSTFPRWIVPLLKASRDGSSRGG